MLQQAENGAAALPTDTASYRIDLATAKVLLRRTEKSVLACALIFATLLAALAFAMQGWAGARNYAVNLAVLICGLGIFAWVRRRRLLTSVVREHPRLVLACGRLSVEQINLEGAPLRVVVPATACCIRRLRRRNATERDFTEVQVPLPAAWLLGPTLHVPVYDHVPGARAFCRALRSAGGTRLPRCGLLRYYWRETAFGAPCIDSWERHALYVVSAVMSVCTILRALFPQAPGIEGAFAVGSCVVYRGGAAYRQWLSIRRRSRSTGQILQAALESSSRSGGSGGFAAV